ncbi:MAG: phosphodiester glycosidase family protein [Myxococcaceae bacterium]|nr:phosphodiester glycosidase family protein [Myxococcaceae bacterium]
MLWAALLLAATPFRPLRDGVDYAELKFSAGATLHVVRIDPDRAPLELALSSRDGKGKRTAKQWADERNFIVTLNAGMFETDHRSNTGRLVDGEHENNAAWKSAYQSVLVLNPKKPKLPSAQIVDLDAPGSKELINQYGSMVQNLRLIKGAGTSVWKKNGRAWSEAAIAQDAQGHILFLFTRAPFQMAEWNEKLLALPLGVVRAFHVEGGPEASLSIHASDVTLDACGSYETGFVEDERNAEQWALPNVIGVKR